MVKSCINNDFARLVENSSNEKDKVFTGIGSRKTPEHVGVLMAAISRKLSFNGSNGWLLRSGGADGADLSFESGLSVEGKREIYLPYPGFNGSSSPLSKLIPGCFSLAQEVHPAWDRCSDFAKKAHARNAYQVFGASLSSPCDMLICWTPDGAVDAATSTNAGGTRTAIVMAQRQAIPVFNLQRADVMSMFVAWVGQDLIAGVKSAHRMTGIKKIKENQTDLLSEKFLNEIQVASNVALSSAEKCINTIEQRKNQAIKFRIR